MPNIHVPSAHQSDPLGYVLDHHTPEIERATTDRAGSPSIEAR